MFELFDALGANDEQLDFPVIYASALNGYASDEDTARDGDMTPLFQAVIEHVPPPQVEVDGPFQMQISSLDYDSYKGVLGIGRITRGTVNRNFPVKIVGTDGKIRDGRMMQIFGFEGLERVETETAWAGVVAATAAGATIFSAPAITMSRKEMTIVCTWGRDFPGLGISAQRLAKRIPELTGGRNRVRLPHLATR